MANKFTPVGITSNRPAWQTPGFNPNEEVNFTPISVIPSKGGLSATNRPNPHGVRAYPTDTGYGGEMMPKDEGWLGILKGIGKMAGKNVTEFSSEDDLGSYPTVVPTLTPQEINMVLKGKVTPEIDKKARQFRDWRVKQGLSPFFNKIND
jgi:hypothetical protein